MDDFMIITTPVKRSLVDPVIYDENLIVNYGFREEFDQVPNTVAELYSCVYTVSGVYADSDSSDGRGVRSGGSYSYDKVSFKNQGEESNVLYYSWELEQERSRQEELYSIVEEYWGEIPLYNVSTVLELPKETLKRENISFIKSNLRDAIERAKEYYSEAELYQLSMLCDWYAPLDGNVPSLSRKQKAGLFPMAEDLESQVKEKKYTPKWLDDFIDDWATK